MEERVSDVPYSAFFDGITLNSTALKNKTRPKKQKQKTELALSTVQRLKSPKSFISRPIKMYPLPVFPLASHSPLHSLLQ